VILGLGLFSAGALVGFLIGACRNSARVLALEAENAALQGTMSVADGES
jgi:hypothetical protein